MHHILWNHIRIFSASVTGLNETMASIDKKVKTLTGFLSSTTTFLSDTEFPAKITLTIDCEMLASYNEGM